MKLENQEDKVRLSGLTVESICIIFNHLGAIDVRLACECQVRLF